MPNPSVCVSGRGSPSPSADCSPRAAYMTTSGSRTSWTPDRRTMASRGITDRVADVGMGCTRFGERWDSSTEDLILEAPGECIDWTPNGDKSDIDAYWLGTLASGQSGRTLSRALSTEYKPVTRVENY